jgi:hypothetical protein
MSACGLCAGIKHEVSGAIRGYIQDNRENFRRLRLLEVFVVQPFRRMCMYKASLLIMAITSMSLVTDRENTVSLIRGAGENDAQPGSISGGIPGANYGKAPKGRAI